MVIFMIRNGQNYKKNKQNNVIKLTINAYLRQQQFLFKHAIIQFKLEGAKAKAKAKAKGQILVCSLDTVAEKYYCQTELGGHV